VATATSADLSSTILFSTANGTNAKWIALSGNEKLILCPPCAEISVDTAKDPRSKAVDMAHIDLAEGAGGRALRGG
jgi:hypothetical protein